MVDSADVVWAVRLSRPSAYWSSRRSLVAENITVRSVTSSSCHLLQSWFMKMNATTPLSHPVRMWHNITISWMWQEDRLGSTESHTGSHWHAEDSHTRPCPLHSQVWACAADRSFFVLILSKESCAYGVNEARHCRPPLEANCWKTSHHVKTSAIVHYATLSDSSEARALLSRCCYPRPGHACEGASATATVSGAQSFANAITRTVMTSYIYCWNVWTQAICTYNEGSY